MTRPVSGSLSKYLPSQSLSLVAVLAQSKSASKAHERFAKLVAKIELRREQLKQWQAYVVRYNQRLLSELEPVRLRLRQGQRQMLLLLDAILNRPIPSQRLGQVYRVKLEHLLRGLLEALPAEDDDEVLRTLRSTYLEEQPDEARRAELNLTRDMLRDVFDLDVGDAHGAASAEELLEQARQTIEEGLERQAQRARTRRARGSGKDSNASSAKAEAAQIRREQAVKEVGQSLRDVYRKLASALHPDRETDEEARQRKTLLMQRANHAYEANDLLTLLALQLEIEQIDADHLASVLPKRLAHYLAILTDQLAELDSELERCVAPFRDNLNWAPGRALSVTAVDQHLSADIAQLRSVVRGIEQDLVAFRDPRRLRASLKHLVLESEVDEFDELEDLADLMAEFAPRAPRRRSRR
jgi:hypothetical protein